jgi:prepilin-type N-terminal cleavage/methylation domain-containing protein
VGEGIEIIIRNSIIMVERKKEQSFTLIELLVVIAVIGLLSAIILVSVKSAREQAEMAKRRTFSQSIKSALGAYTKGEWTFDNGDLTDISGNQDNGTSIGLDIVDGGLDGKGIRTIVGQNSLFQVLLLTPEKISERGFTFEAWVYPYSSDNPGLFYFFDYAGNCSLFYSYDTLAFVCGCTADITKDFKDLFEINKWNHIAAVMDGEERKAKIYINSELVAFTFMSGVCHVPTTWLRYFDFINPTIYPSVDIKLDQIRVYDGGF